MNLIVLVFVAVGINILAGMQLKILGCNLKDILSGLFIGNIILLILSVVYYKFSFVLVIMAIVLNSSYFIMYRKLHK